MYDLQHTLLYRSARYDSVGAPFVGCGVGVTLYTWFELCEVAPSPRVPWGQITGYSNETVTVLAAAAASVLKKVVLD